MTTVEAKRRFFQPTPGKLLIILLATEGILFLADWFHWLPKGWAVLITLAAMSVFFIVMLLWFAVALLYRWRFQFSIRLLLVLMVAVAMPFSWLEMEMRDAKRQRAAASVIRPPGYVVYNWQCDCDGQLIGEPREPAWLLNLFGVDFFSEVTEVIIWGQKDTELEPLKGTRLEKLHLSDRG